MSKIEWTHRPGTKSEVLNPTTGCDKVSQGCKNCYAEVMHKRLTGMGQTKYQEPFLGHVRYWPDELAKPFKWKKPRTVFLNSMSDIFHKDVPVVAIAEIYAMMFLTPDHTYIVLTKRADRAKDVLKSEEFFFEYAKACNRLHDKYNQRLETALYFEEELKTMWPLKNVWQGVSVEHQDQMQRVRDLGLTPAHIRVVSAEPLLGPLNFSERLFQYSNGSAAFPYLKDSESTMLIDMINWIIVGGESGRKARPYHPEWIRAIRDQCASANVPFFLKQFGEWGTRMISISTGHPKFKMYRDYLHFTQKDWVNKGDVCIDMNGKICKIGADFKTAAYPVAIISKMGKHDTGNTLDGKQHLNFPVV